MAQDHDFHMTIRRKKEEKDEKNNFSIGGWVLGFAGVLLAVSLIIPSVAVAQEIHLQCGQAHYTVDPDHQKAFGFENKVEDKGPTYGVLVTRVTISSEEYKAEAFFPDGSPLHRWTLNRITGTLTRCSWSNYRASCDTVQCEKISGAPKF